MKKIGLTLGKFAPLHKGHQYLIETALKEVEELILVIYNSDNICPIPLNIRANWIRKLYPKVKIIEAWDGPDDMGDTPEIKSIQETYIKNILQGKKITHFYSSEFYGEHMSSALKAINRIVDRQRNTFNISGTLIRKNAYKYKEYIDPLVYKDLITNIVFLGAPSSGKTTIAKGLAEEYRTLWMPEYGREYWEKNQINRRLTLPQLTEIAEEHLTREDDLILKSNKYIFTDTNAITTYLFSLYYHGKADKKLIKLAKIAEKRYDLFFLCDIDIPYDDSWDRSGDANRKVFQKQIIADLKQREISYVILRGDITKRINSVKLILNKLPTSSVCQRKQL